MEARTTGAIARGEVTTLRHEARDNTVERRALEGQRHTLSANALLARAEGLEVLRSLGDDVVEERELDAASLYQRGREASVNRPSQGIPRRRRQ